MENRENPIISKKFSLEGWSLGKFIRGNKEIIKIVVPFCISILTTNNPGSIGLITIIGKGLLDIVDYYCNEQTGYNVNI